MGPDGEKLRAKMEEHTVGAALLDLPASTLLSNLDPREAAANPISLVLEGMLAETPSLFLLRLLLFFFSFFQRADAHTHTHTHTHTFFHPSSVLILSISFYYRTVPTVHLYPPPSLLN